MADDLALGEPAGGRPIDPLDATEAQIRRQSVVDKREIGAKTRRPALPKAGAGAQDALREGPRLSLRRLVEVDLVTTGDKVYIGSSFLQEACEVSRARPGTDNGYSVTAEPIKLCVLRTVADEAGGWV